MLKSALLFLLFGVICVSAIDSHAQTALRVRLADVRSIYLDEKSFRFTFSSCGTSAGGMILPCPAHSKQRLLFLEALKRWIEKSDFALTDDRDSAEGILQGTMMIDEIQWPGDRPKRHRKDKDKDHDEEYETYESHQPRWSVDAWMLNADGRRIWRSNGYHPEISYGWSSLAKVEGKRLAKALEYDAKHGN